MEIERKVSGVDAKTRDLYVNLTVVGCLALVLVYWFGPPLIGDIISDCRWLLPLDIMGLVLIISVLSHNTYHETFLPSRWDFPVLVSGLICPWLMVWYVGWIVVFAVSFALAMLTFIAYCTFKQHQPDEIEEYNG